MNQRFIPRLLLCTAALLIPVLPAYSETKIKGTYVFVEEGMDPMGQAIGGLALFQFAETGAVTGTEMIPTSKGVVRLDLQGSYTPQSDGTISLVLTAPGSDEEGNTQNIMESYRLLTGRNGEIHAVRTNDGFYSIARLYPAKANALRGAYMFAQKPNGEPMARLVQLVFDGTGNSKGFQVLASQTMDATLELKGTTQNLPDGFGSLTLVSTISNDDGETTAMTENYLYLSTETGVKMLRTDCGRICIITLVQ